MLRRKRASCAGLSRIGAQAPSVWTPMSINADAVNPLLRALAGLARFVDNVGVFKFKLAEAMEFAL